MQDVPLLKEHLAPAHTRFGLKLLRELARGEEGNVFVSPPSVAFALAMTYNGAGGETREAMARALEVAGLRVEEVNAANAAWLAALRDPGASVELTVANSLWVRDGVPVLPDFLQRTRDAYGAEATALDFGDPAAADTINAWVREQTRDRVPGIVQPPIDPQTFMFLINAVYFKGTWERPFSEELTEERPFTRADGSRVPVPMMSRTGAYPYLDGDGFRAVRLPYKGGRFTLEVLLPDEGSTLSGLVARLDAAAWEGWMEGYQPREVELALPRFSLEYETELNDALTALGMGAAFDARRADFTGMVPREWLGTENAYISSVRHKTFLEVNEKGTEAAAATSVEMRVTSAGPPPVSFVVDRPFLLAIRDAETGTLLFLGAIAGPS